MKLCPKCKIDHPLDQFAKDNSRLDKLQVHCKICQKLYRNTHKDEIRIRNEKWRSIYKPRKKVIDSIYRISNIERIKKEKQRYYQKHKLKIHEKVKQRLQTNPIAKLQHSLRTRLKDSLRRGTKSGSFVRDLGCSIEELKQYLESKFQLGMTWENHGRTGWHIDHIKPLSSFDLTNREQFLQACHYTNLQPLWAKENLSKGAKLCG